MIAEFHQPNEEKLKEFLNRYRCQPNGLAISLAWQAGLNRQEISDLTWEQVDLENRLLRLPEREVPVCEELYEYLVRWEERGRTELPYVVVSKRQRKHISPQGLSSLIRDAMEEMNCPEVGFVDLRYDFIRRQLQENDWPYVLRIAGVSTTSWNNGLSKLFNIKANTTHTQDSATEEFLLWEVLQKNKDTPEGIALWLFWEMGLSLEKIVSLQWDDFDFEQKTVQIDGVKILVPQPVADILKAEYARRGEHEDAHIILSPKARKPIDRARIAVMIRTLLIRGGIESKSLLEMRANIKAGKEKKQLLDFMRKNGCITLRMAEEKFGYSADTAYRRLCALVEDGSAVHLSSGYYPAEDIIPPERQEDAILQHIANMKFAYCGDVAALLHIGKRPTQKLLKELVNQGKLQYDSEKKGYRLPD